MIALRSRLLVVAAAILLGAAAMESAHAQWADEGERAGLEGCTIGVASGRATADGRPLLWKTRDAEAEHNEARWQVAYPYSFVGVFNADGESPWMAVNTKGFALLNANALDLPGTGNSGNGSFMRLAMAECATVAEFRRLLDSTNGSTRRTQAHFAVIDTTGAAALFETGGREYWMYDACDSSCAEGYVIRTNFAIHGGGAVGFCRYQRSRAIVGALRSSNQLSPRGIVRDQMRDFADAAGNPFPIPYPARIYPGVPFGYIGTASSICGATSVSAAVIQGVLNGEPAVLTTMWTLLGLPAATVTLPFWPVGPTPSVADGTPTAPLCDEANRLHALLFRFFEDPVTRKIDEYVDSYKLRTGLGMGIWGQLLPAEETIFHQAEEELARWRTTRIAPPAAEMLTVEENLAGYAYTVLRSTRIAPDDRTGEDQTNVELAQNYPNPFNAGTVIRFTLPEHGHVRLRLFDVMGRSVRDLLDEERAAGTHELHVDAASLASGVYWYRLNAGGVTLARTLVVVR